MAALLNGYSIKNPDRLCFSLNFKIGRYILARRKRMKRMLDLLPISFSSISILFIHEQPGNLEELDIIIYFVCIPGMNDLFGVKGVDSGPFNQVCRQS